MITYHFVRSNILGAKDIPLCKIAHVYILSRVRNLLNGLKRSICLSNTVEGISKDAASI